MRSDLLRDVSFWLFLLSVDEDLAAKTRKKGCPCSGRLHCADYPRKPRGGPEDLPEQYRERFRKRFSFCCNQEGCRKRTTPPSVRFLGRKGFLGAVVILVAAVRQGPTPRRVRTLSELFEVDRRTITRWQTFWREHFPRTSFWKVARARLVPVFDVAVLPRSLLNAFVRTDNDREGWKRLLLFLSPITVTGGLEVEVFR